MSTSTMSKTMFDEAIITIGAALRDAITADPSDLDVAYQTVTMAQDIEDRQVRLQRSKLIGNVLAGIVMLLALPAGMLAIKIAVLIWWWTP